MLLCLPIDCSLPLSPIGCSFLISSRTLGVCSLRAERMLFCTLQCFLHSLQNLEEHWPPFQEAKAKLRVKLCK